MALRVENPAELTDDQLPKYEAAWAAALKKLPTPEQFWTRERRLAFPHFARVLPFILPIPATSVACESLFSHASLVLGRRRNRLHDGSLSTLTILHFETYSLVQRLLDQDSGCGSTGQS